jgi:hypothetical protein
VQAISSRRQTVKFDFPDTLPLSQLGLVECAKLSEITSIGG